MMPDGAPSGQGGTRRAVLAGHDATVKPVAETSSDEEDHYPSPWQPAGTPLTVQRVRA